MGTKDISLPDASPQGSIVIPSVLPSAPPPISNPLLVTVNV